MCPVNALSKANQSFISGVPKAQPSSLAVISQVELEDSSKRIIEATVNEGNKNVKGRTVKRLTKIAVTFLALSMFAPKVRNKWFKNVEAGEFDKSKMFKQDYKGLFVKFADYVEEKQKVVMTTVQKEYNNIKAKTKGKAPASADGVKPDAHKLNTTSV